MTYSLGYNLKATIGPAVSVVRHSGVKAKQPHLKDKIHQIPIHIMGSEDYSYNRHITHCGHQMYQGSGGVEEHVGPEVNCEEWTRIRNNQEADAGLWVYYKACQPCMSEQLNRLGQDYWSDEAVDKRSMAKALSELADTDL